MLQCLKQSIKNISLKKKLLFSYSLVVLVPVVMIGYFFIYNIIQQSIHQTRSSNEISFNQMVSNVETFFNDYTQLLDNMKYDIQLTEFLKKTYTSDIDNAQRYFDYYFVSKSYAERLAYQRIKDVNVAIHTSNNHITKDQDFILRTTDNELSTSWYSHTIRNTRINNICDPISINGKYFITMTASMAPDSLFTNILKVDIPESQLYNMMEKEAADKSVYIVNSDYIIISSTNRSSIGQNLYGIENVRDALPKLTNIDRKITLEDKGVTFFVSKLNSRTPLSPNWVISVVSSRPLINQISEITIISLSISLIVIIFDIVLIFLFSNGITVRIDRLAQAMGKVKNGRFNISVDYEGKDEISVLSRNFKEMLDRTDTLINEVYTSQLQIKNLELKAKDAEIHALQSQINPHFLFNCLESIKTNVLKGNNFETADIIVSFSKMIRKSCDWRSDQVPLRNEMELVEDYLKIQKFRYREKLDYRISIDTHYDEVLIPKFTLQPVVENALYHGIERKKNGGCILIHTEPFEGELKIIIQDSGAGIEKETLFRIQENLNNWHNPISKERIGMLNVHQRLKLNYGEAYGLSISSSMGEGTTVTVTLPLTVKKSSEENDATKL
jgi:two-component system, sensor histidine kinase YesM